MGTFNVERGKRIDKTIFRRVADSGVFQQNRPFADLPDRSGTGGEHQKAGVGAAEAHDWPFGPRFVAGPADAPFPTVAFAIRKTEPRLGSIV
jgi:hypothetical protein